MKRVFRYMIMSAAVVAAVACAKEIAETENPSGGNEPEGEGVTFTAYIQNDEAPASPSATKVAIDIDETAGTAKVSFTAGDFVAVSAQKTGTDGKTETIVDRITLNAENINADGSATFTAPNVPADAETYLAYFSDKNTLNSFGWPSYVYTNAKKDGWDFIEIAAGRIPHAAFANCGSDRKLSFRNMLTLLKFRTETSGVSSVEFKGNNGENVIGMVVGNYSTGAVSLVSFNTETNCFPVAKAIVSAPNTDCYIALAPGVTMSKGFTMTAYDASGKVLFVSKYDKSFTTAAGKLLDFGKLEDHQMTPYDLWQAGYDLEIGGKTYNKAEYPLTVTHVTKDKTNAVVYGPGVWFIDSDASVSVAGYHDGSVIVVGNTVGERSKISLSGSYTRGDETREHHVVAFKNMEIESNSGSEFLPGATDRTHNEKGTVVIDDCFVTLNKSFLKCDNSNGNRGAVAGLTVVNSDICVTASDIVFFNTWNSAWDSTFPELSLIAKNNVIWSNDGHKLFVLVAGLNSGAGVWPFSTIVLENNTLYNVYTGVPNDAANAWRFARFSLGLVTADKIPSSNFSVKNNMFYTSEATSTDRFFSVMRIKSETWAEAKVKSENAAAGNWSDHHQIAFCSWNTPQDYDGDSMYWRYSITWVNNTGETKTEPFESFDLTTGAFKMKSGYTQYGAQR